MKHNLKNTEHFTLQRDGADILNLDAGVVTSMGVSGNNLTWSLGNVPQTPITIPYATSAGSASTASSAGNADTVDNKHAVDLENLVEITWSSLKSARDSGTLIPGKQYRITDYTCTTTQADTQSAGHQFDIIVTADSVNTLNENARAKMHLDNGSSIEHIVIDLYGDRYSLNRTPNHDDLGNANPYAWYFSEYDSYYYTNSATPEVGDIVYYNSVSTEAGEYTVEEYHPHDYFNDCNLDAWELKYCLDNDKSRFAWANNASDTYITIRYDEDETHYYRSPDNDMIGDQYQYPYAWSADGSFIVYTYMANPENGEGVYTESTSSESFGTVDTFHQGGDEIGKGVIYYMKDEFGNECGYDFKNIMMKFYKITAVTTVPSDLNNTYSVSKVIGTDDYTITSGCTVSSSNTEFRYTFDLYSSSTHSDYSLNTASSNKAKFCYDNVITPMYGFTSISDSTDNKKMWINFISFRNTSNDDVCYGNKFGAINYNMSFGNGCSSNTFGNDCQYNTFGTDCYSNTFGDYCYSNTFGNNCYSNTFRNNCRFNTFRNNCRFNTFGTDCYSNTFGNNCRFNTFGNNCRSNTFGTDCYSNTFGNSCRSNTFGTNCYSNTFGTDCYSNTFRNNCRFNTFGTDCYSNTFNNYCRSNTFGNDCYSNTFGTDCYSNTFGTDCYSNTFGNYCSSNTFGNSCQYIKFGNSSSAKSYYEGIIVENQNKYIYLDTTQTTSSSNKIQNVKIAQGVNNTTTYKTISHNTVNDAFQTVYQSTNSVIVNV